MDFSGQEYWSGWPFPSPGDLPDPGIKPGSPAVQAVSIMSVGTTAPAWISLFSASSGPYFFYHFFLSLFITYILPTFEHALSLHLEGNPPFLISHFPPITNSHFPSLSQKKF